jgi:predicted TIM-barrel fold metal-dependent hydrolase
MVTGRYYSLFRCGAEMKVLAVITKQAPDLGSVKYAEELVRFFPKVNFIPGHAGGLDVEEVSNLLGKYNNVWE